MNIHQLQYFYDAARFSSVTEAAKSNYVTQSAVSQAIRSLESVLGSKLILHGKNSFELTDEGKIVLNHCQTVFGALSNLKAQITHASKKVSGKLALASTNSIALTFLAPTLKKITIDHPDLSIELKLGNSEQVKQSLIDRDAEIGFILEEDDMDDFESKPIKEGEFLLVASPKLKIKELPDKIIITRKNKVEIRHLQAEVQKKLKRSLGFKMEVFSWELIRQLCCDGAGVGYLPDYLVDEDLNKNKLQVVQKDLRGWKYKLLAIQLKNKVESYNTQYFLKQL